MYKTFIVNFDYTISPRSEPSRDTLYVFIFVYLFDANEVAGNLCIFTGDFSHVPSPFAVPCIESTVSK